MALITNTLWSLYHKLLRLLDPSHPVSLALRAEEELGRRNWGAAFDLSNAAVKKREDFAPAYFVRGVARLHLDDYDGALRDLNGFLSFIEDPPSLAYYWRGWVYVHLHEWSLALADFDRIEALAPDDPQLHYWRAYSYWQRQEWEQMRRVVEHLEALVPSSPLVWELRGHLLLHEGQFHEAEAAYSRTMDAGVDHPDLRYNRAIVRRQLERFEEARVDLEMILQMEPDNLWAQAELSNVALALGDYEEALRHARAAIELDPCFFEARVGEVAILLAQGKTGEARDCVESLREIFPDEPFVDQLYGDFLAREGEVESAVVCYRRVLTHDPSDHTVRVKLAGELITLERYEEAEMELARVLAEDTRNVEAYATRADLYRYTDRPDEMSADLDYLLELDPNNAWALIFRAAYRQWAGDEAGAREAYDAALDAEKGEGWMWAFRGQFHLRFGRLERAREDFQQAITLDPADSWIRRQWAEHLYQSGQEELAMEVLQCLVRDCPDDGFARMTLADLHMLTGAWEAAREQLTWVVESEHELDWLAHAALAALTEGEVRENHLDLAERRRPKPAFWGMTPATVLAQRVIVAWQQGNRGAAQTLLREAMRRLEPGEQLWLALQPLARRLDAPSLLALLDQARIPLRDKKS